MEQHPVPQNVTTFQFRLIGDMTIKQFGYLAGGAIAGYIFYKLPLPFFFTWPLAISSVILGIGLAFVPIEERPMDIWLLSFIKSIYSPTQYLWSRSAEQKTNPPAGGPQAAPIAPPAAPVVPSAPHVVMTKPQESIGQTLSRLFTYHPKPAPAAPLAQPVPQKVPKPEITRPFILSQRTQDPFGWIKELFTTKPKMSSAPAPYPDIFTQTQPLPSLTGKKVDLSQTPAEAPSVAQQQTAAAAQIQTQTKERELAEKLTKLQTELTSKEVTDTRVLELQKQLTDVLSQKNTMEQELTALRQKITRAAQTPQVVRQAETTSAPPAQPTVRIISPDTAVRAGLPRLTTFPNVVTGIIKDYEGNLLPSILITVRDKDDMPVRALKTNKLGQFAASTPLPNGVYTVDIEDPRQQHFFDRVRTTLNGEVMAPIEVTSKSKKQMERSKLEQAIFGGGQI